MQRSHNTTDILVLLYCIVLFVQKLVNYCEEDELIEQWVVSPAPGTVIYVLRTWSVHSRQALGPCLGSPGSSIISRNTANFPLRHKTKVVQLLFLRIQLKLNNALLSTVRPSVCVCVTGVTSHISHIYKGINAMLIIRDPSTPISVSYTHLTLPTTPYV